MCVKFPTKGQALYDKKLRTPIIQVRGAFIVRGGYELRNILGCELREIFGYEMRQIFGYGGALCTTGTKVDLRFRLRFRPS